MIVIQAVAIAMALVLLVTMALGPEIQDWHERNPVGNGRPELPRSHCLSPEG